MTDSLFMGAEIVEQIDVPYRTILNAADKHSSKNTYVEAAKLHH